jgi:L-fuculose-phosphate aldolase
MKKVLSAKDIEAMLREGADLRALPPDAILTPSARDLVREAVDNPRQASRPSALAAAPGASPKSTPGPGAPAKPVSAASPKADLEAFFSSPDLQRLKESICDIGHRLWQRAYVDGNGGNIAIRVAPDLVLCTPTLVSKGFMKPADLCLVDLEGNQLAGPLKRTSEILMHLQIMKRQPRAVATVHCHPPHATAFAVAGLEPPTCLIPELEVFVGRVPVAPYRTPGTPEMGQLVADLVEQHNTILMGNHGAVSWSHLDVQDAYFKMEILEAYCRTVWVASQLGAPLKTISPGQLQDLLKIKQNLGIPDPRIGLKECELCDNSDWRPGVVCQIPGSDGPGPAPDPEAERVVQVVTDLLMEKLGKA